ncbi:hypothetical protein SCLCIDRAFT_16470 [Scleroderma citrinum Foug A]|uniref:40S ribosomal protein S4 C-terminal domain-containing protein n=1 Tax=Scleroderma citrinum Foug A TaxID=1036808 RepID=A0A0C3DUP7_9AGAM|nr:hypothetical protein SCLCIDRAFT_16470 [Scleroderma citrinum Foug A]
MQRLIKVDGKVRTDTTYPAGFMVALGAKGVPHIVTHDGRTIRYPNPAIRVNDTVKFDLEQGNMSHAGIITHRENHIGGFDIVPFNCTFATRITNIFVIGDGNKPWISLPRGKGIKLTISEERDYCRKQTAEQ